MSNPEPNRSSDGQFASSDTGLKWEQAVEKGDLLIQAMQANQTRAAELLGLSDSQSKFKTIDDLTKNGWVRDNPRSTFIDPCFREKLKLAQTTNSSINWIYDDLKSEDGLPPVLFSSTYDAQQKIICSVYSKSPIAYQRKSKVKSDQKLPELKHWSDVTYLEWASNQTTAPHKLDYICRMCVTNADTRRIVWQAFKSAVGDGSDIMSDKTFPMTSEHGKAILGTPNGRGVAYFLINHKDAGQMGLKEIESVRAFQIPDTNLTDEFKAWGIQKNSKLYLVFRIKNVEV